MNNYKNILSTARKYMKQEANENGMDTHAQANFGHLNIKSGIWGAPNKNKIFEKAETGTFEEAIHYCQEGGHIVNGSFGLNHTREFPFIVEEFINYLKNKQNFDFNTAPIKFCEVPFSSPNVTVLLNNRLISPEFLYKLIIALRIQDHVNLSQATVVEIGAGLGTLSRCIKLLHPTVNYAIIDLPETLFFAYIFLRASFPEAKILYVVNQNQLIEIDQTKYDFIFIPARLATALPKGLRVDLVCNTHSLGEMRQKTVNDYMGMIQEHLAVKFFYSMNRFLQTNEHINIHTSGEYQALSSLVLDPYWKINKWNYRPEFLRIPPSGLDSETTLEVLLERIQDHKKNSYDVVNKSQLLLKEALKYDSMKSYKWLRLIWESINLHPTKDNIRIYYNYLKNIGAREVYYYHPIMERHDPNIDELKMKKHIKPTILNRLKSKLKKMYKH